VQYFTHLSRLSLSLSAFVLLSSCGGSETTEPTEMGDSPAAIERDEAQTASSESSLNDVAEEVVTPESTTSVLAPYFVGDGIREQAVGPIEPNTWRDLMTTDGVLLSVVDLGEAPRRLLRLTPEVGQVETLEFEMAMTMGMSMGGEGLVMMDTPNVSFTIESELLSMDAEEGLSLRWTYTGVDVAEGIGLMAGQEELMEAEMRGLVGLSGLQTMNSLGYPLSSSMSLTDDLSPMMREQMRSVEGMLDAAAFVLPGQAVGAGASWETLRELENNGFSFLVHQVVNLTALTDTQAMFTVTTTQALGDSAPNIPNLPVGAEVEVTSLVSDGTGEITLVEGMMNSKLVQSDLAMSIEMQVSGLGPEPMEMALQNQTGLKVTAEVVAE
jgi:hypothetical protein